MRIVYLECDRCGSRSPYSGKDPEGAVKMRVIERDGKERSADLCGACDNALRAWMLDRAPRKDPAPTLVDSAGKVVPPDEVEEITGDDPPAPPPEPCKHKTLIEDCGERACMACGLPADKIPGATP